MKEVRALTAPAILVLLLAASPAALAAPAAPAATAPPSVPASPLSAAASSSTNTTARTKPGEPASARQPGGDLDFLLANLLAGEGMLPEAIAEFEQAEKAQPDSAYVHLEHAQLLARLAQAARLPNAQTGYLRKAAEEVTKARQIAPDNLDVLRGVGLIYLELSSQDPSALHTALEALEAVHQGKPEDLQTAINLGRLYLEQQQPGKAAAVFRDVIRLAPQQRAAYALLVEALLRDDKAKDAETVLGQILDFEPAALEARLTLAELEARRNDYAAVLATLTAAPEPGSADPRLQRQLAWAYYLTGDVDRALATVEPLLRLVPPAGRVGDGNAAADADDMQLELLEGLALAAQGHNQEAGERLEKLRAARPTDSALAAILARVLERAGRPDEAARVLSELDANLAKAGKRDEERQARLELAQVYYDAKQWDRVSEALQPLLKPDAQVSGGPSGPSGASAPSGPSGPAGPSGPSGKSGSPGAAGPSGAGAGAGAARPPRSSGPGGDARSRGGASEESAREPAVLLAADALVQRKSYDEALRLLDANRAEAASPAIAAKRAEVLWKAGRQQEATRQLADLAAAGDPLGPLAAAETYQRLDRYAESIPVLEKLLTRPQPEIEAPRSKAARFLLGAAYERTGKREQAVTEFRRLLGADPDYHAALNYLGYMFAERGENLDEARRLIEKAVALEPDNGAYVDSLGWVYYRLGRYEQARAALERATRLETADGTVQEHLGDVYGALGQPEQATRAYRRALELQSGDPAKADEVRRKLDSLGGGQRRP